MSSPKKPKSTLSSFPPIYNQEIPKEASSGYGDSGNIPSSKNPTVVMCAGDPIVDPMEQVRRDFRVFLFCVWKHINLPDPTELQYDIAKFLQHGPNKTCIEAFRGVGKSFITSAYALWELLKDPQKKILVVSASKNRADNFTTFTMRLLQEMPMLAHLRPRDEQRCSKIEFDVGPALPDQSPSMKSVGITSQITGSRADIIIADDVEVMNNSATSDMREVLLAKTREFSAVLKPLPNAKIIYLGTPQTEDSIYNKLPSNFLIRIWPALIPTAKEAEGYGDKLAPYVKKMLDRPGQATDPSRFTVMDLMERQGEYGKAGFSLQFMLNTQLSDLDRYPLKVKDLIVMMTSVDKAPMSVNWLPDPDRECKDINNMAMPGDRFYLHAGHSKEFSEYTGSVLAIDPSGRGKDETGYAVVKMLNGYLYVRKLGGLQGGYDDDTLKRLAEIARDEQVNAVVIEANFGDGLFTKVFQPVLFREHKCRVDEVKHSTQKERRIIDTLEPLLGRHKIIVDKSVLHDDWETTQQYESSIRVFKSVVYQMTRISYERGALRFDDRLDALAIGVAYFTEQMARDEREGILRMRQDAFEKDLRGFINNVFSKPPKNTRQWVRR